MSERAPVQDFSDWDGSTPFFTGQPEQGRRVYLDKRDDSFMAYGVIEPSPQYVFRVQGTGKKQLHRFLKQVKDEGAKVTHGPPPFEVKTGGDKPPTSDSTPPGYLAPKPIKR
ncbi:hypothetical protein [Pyxidicoccus sp. MSG2]|uniref:hypothetical protein n=1 Tax=Pyxidicoccus sp. MSG2 TaxID=2996790 RepID=UPI002271AA52|nr:hypothetical protein [Pyxidicoccus sp. MSG2]MCY1018623.1 hypothetical protein [Pyxidicoccus sp. MSG2]